MRYVRAKIDEDGERLSFRAYVTDSLRLKGEGKYIPERWIEIIEPQRRDDRSAEQIAADIMAGAGLRFGG